MTTRQDPNLPLARYRARGQMTELRTADLRFTAAEAAEFLNQVMGLDLADEEIAALETRTEGWIAGLQMAALSMQGRADTARFIQAFTGSHRFVLDYLVEEVLHRQPERVQHFLLQTSILDRLCDQLCNAVTGGDDGKAMLETLERGNLFLIPLDEQRQWYRYHHLFADILQVRARDEEQARATDQSSLAPLHQRASAWYAQQGLPTAAICHALAAKDFVRAAALVELAWPAILKGFHPATWLGWVQQLPRAVVDVRPVLNVGAAWTLLDGGEVEAAAPYLRAAERWLPSPADRHDGERDAHHDEASAPSAPSAPADDLAKMVVVNEEAFQSLPANIAIARAYLSQAQGDVTATVAYAQRALELLSPSDDYWRGIASMFLGLAYWNKGDLAAAYRAIASCVASLQLTDNSHFQIVATVFLADLRMAQGRLHDAARAYDEALQLAQPNGAQTGPAPDQPGDVGGRGTANLYVGLSGLYYERGDLETATAYVQRGFSLIEQAGALGSEYRLYAALARIKLAQGSLDDALAQLHEAERQYRPDAIPDARPTAALKARVWILQGNVAEAWHWAEEQALSADDELTYRREFDHITLARLLIADYQRTGLDRARRDALGLLARLLHAAEEGGRMGSVIEVLVLEALVHQIQGDNVAARKPLDRAVTLAAPEGYSRVFLNEGAPMQQLLAATLPQAAAPAYTTHLLTMLNEQLGDTTPLPDPNQLLIEPLSERELDVLQLLALGHTNGAVADELVIAVSTVKKHVNNIFGKLGVGNRTQAINRARELGII